MQTYPTKNENENLKKYPSGTWMNIENLKKQYPKGTLIELDYMDDPQAPPRGTRGTVMHVDSMGQIHCEEFGLAIVLGVDRFHKIIRYKVNEVKDEINDKIICVLVDTIGTGLPLVHEDKKDNVKDMFIYDLADYLNKNIGL